ncbi:MAG TPA: type VII secretion protein EccCa [Actinophytocola sp.]|uniref:type VII secretion protein EccCa n=1 Tax=Actinophytocola sp. TaxID=1872138 RepID=UPI002DFA80E3|nr:type VII secretion protein EccCa [Actinophytocola sp.]
MSTTIVRRPPRRAAPKVENGEFPMQEPPGLPEAQGGQLSSMFMYLPMAASSAMMMLVFIQPGQNRILMYAASGMMAVSMLAMGLVQLTQVAGQRKQKLKGERRDYLRYLGQVRKVVRKAVDKQRESVLFTHPDPAKLWALALPGAQGRMERLWERRAVHPDFAEVRFGLGEQRLALKLTPPQTKPVEDLEPLCASALRRFLKAYTTVGDVPVAVYLRGFAKVSLDVATGEPDAGEAGRGLVRALLAQLAVFHAPDDLRIAVCAASDRLAEWDWVKWLPHAAHPTENDAAGPVRLINDSWPDLETLLDTLGGPDCEPFGERARFEAGAEPSAEEPFVVVVLDGGHVPANARLGGQGYRNLVVLDVTGSLGWSAEKTALRLRVTTEAIETVTRDRRGNDKTRPLGQPDGLSLIRARALARQLAPYRIAGAEQSTNAWDGTIDLHRLLGAGDPGSFDPTALWTGRSSWDHLRVPIGVTDRGEPVELDLKESALGGMGPHGILIGATGSGKSELIRTLVLSLAMSHSSEKLNMVLVDFKGGATFLGLEHLPHVSAFITNLADELPLVDRMQDALQGELIRRQELLRAAGHSSIHDYEKARAGGAVLPPLPTLVIIVDEFGELLATKSEFMDLFVMIGRLGRSLGVHLLLASQRLEEGRISQLETHLSYRMGLRVFSAMESRSILGVTDAYDKPLSPGQGFLRTSTTSLEKFKAAYVSAPYRSGAPKRAGGGPVIEHRVVPFGVGYQAPLTRPHTDEADEQVEEESEATETILNVTVDRLRQAGPPAHRVWLPPLDTPATLDQLLPPLVATPTRGLGAQVGGLMAPVGLIDKPFEQRRDLLVADLEGGRGHVAVVSAPQMGKTTLLRTLVAGLALTNTPREVQFYCLDFGGGGLSSLAGLPHVGSVAGRLDKDRVTRTVREVGNLLDHRETVFTRDRVESMAAYRRAKAGGRFAEDPYGDVFLVIDGWQSFRTEYEPLESVIQEIAGRGLTYGVHLIVTANRWSEIRTWLRDMVQTRFELRLGDSSDSEIDFRKARSVPELPGRGLTPDKYHYLSALPRIDGRPDPDNLADGVTALVAAVAKAWTGPPAPQVRLLPDRLQVSELPRPEGDLRVAIGVDEERLAPVWHDFATSPHLMAFGDTETGKSNLLRMVARAVTDRFTPEEARIMVADPRRALHDATPPEYQLGYTLAGSTLEEMVRDAVKALRDRLPPADITPDRLARKDWWTGPRLFLLIDDYDLLTSPMSCPVDALVDLLAQGAEIGLHVVVARTTSNAHRGMVDPLIRRLWDISTPGLVFSCRREEGTFLGDAKPRKLPPGRAQLVDRRHGVRLIQTALVPPPAADAEQAA